MTQATGVGSIGRRLAVGLLVVVGLLPLANWIPGGHESPTYPSELNGWLSGTAIVVGVGLVLALLSRRFTTLWRPGAAGRLVTRADPADGRALLVVALVALAAYLTVAWLTFDARPLLIDEVVQTLQARMYATGHLWRPEGADPAFRSIMHMVEHDGKVFGHFPPGGPLWLLPGVVLGASWLMVPLAGALAVVAFGLVLRRIEPSPAVRGGAVLLFALAPFSVFMAGSHMNHTTVLMWLLFFAAALVRLVEQPGRLGLALGAGLALGMAAITRPAEALAFGAAGGVWILARAIRRPREWAAAIAVMGVAALVPVAGMMVVNLETTGGLLRSGYQMLWGANVGLGFHPAPWGPPHTPARGVELLSIYLFRLNTYLYEAPVPSLLPAFGALLLVPTVRSGDRFLLGAAGLVLLLYFAYWFDGFFLGPRFVHSLIPVAALWTARLPGLLKERFGGGVPLRTVCYGGGVAAVLALAISIPIRERQYANGLYQMRWDVDRALADLGAKDPLIFVHESWGAQVLARLWALGVTRPESERLYRNVDLCVLDQRVGALESEGATRDPFPALAPAMADSARLVSMAQVPDTTARVLPGTRYGPECVDRIRADLRGIALLPPVLLTRRKDVVVVRDLGARDTVMLDRYPDRSVYLVRRPSGSDLPRLEPISRDSLLTLGALGPAPER
jgi:hypothetical protein